MPPSERGVPRRGGGENARGMNSPGFGNHQGATPHSSPSGALRHPLQQFSFWCGPLRRPAPAALLSGAELGGGNTAPNGRIARRCGCGQPTGWPSATPAHTASRLDGLRPRGSPLRFRVPRPQPPSSGAPVRRRGAARLVGRLGVAGTARRRIGRRPAARSSPARPCIHPNALRACAAHHALPLGDLLNRRIRLRPGLPAPLRITVEI